MSLDIIGPDPDLPPLPAGMETRGGDPLIERDELLSIIATHIDNHPRSQQTRIGPSELGAPCARRIAYKLNGTPESNVRSAAWRPTVGTACHTWLESAMQAHNDAHTVDRFYLEERVTVGIVGGTPVDGSCDCYDRFTATVIDWKVVGPTSLKKYKRQRDPGPQYRAQAHLYGRGFVAKGLPVDHVAVMFLPSAGELTDAYYWTEPYDEAVALEALTRADGIAALVAALGDQAPAAVPTADDCRFCPFLREGSTDLAAGCPGDASRPVRADSTLSLIA